MTLALSTGGEIALALLAALFGALIGAAAVYGFARYQAVSESKERRRVLAEALRHELQLIASVPDAYNVGQTIYRDPIRLTSLRHMLDGRALNFRQHGDLIRSLIRLSATLQVHNDLVTMTNLAQSTTTLPDTTHRQMYDSMASKHSAVIAARQAVLPALDQLMQGSRRWPFVHRLL